MLSRHDSRGSFALTASGSRAGTDGGGWRQNRRRNILASPAAAGLDQQRLFLSRRRRERETLATAPEPKAAVNVKAVRSLENTFAAITASARSPRFFFAVFDPLRGW
jgi:hypothetical protein